MTSSPKPRPVFIAAMQREIASVVHGWRADEVRPSRDIHIYWNEDAVVACAGMGCHRASLAVEAALALGPASELISVGFAGACRAGMRIGDVLFPTIVIDSKTGERFFIQEPETTEASQILVTVAAPAGAVEKQRLGIRYYASAVDMEAAAVARIARARETPFYAIKAISDDSEFELPEMAKFATPTGQFREAAFGLHVAVHPSLWSPVVTLAKGSKLAAEHLHAAIEAHIQQHRERTL